MSDQITVPTNTTETETDFKQEVTAVWHVVVRRRWWILATACGVALATMAVLWRIPNRYRSEATVLVVQQQVPERYVIPNSTTNIGAALEAMKREVLSRARLLTIRDEFDLYRTAKRRSSEEIVTMMLNDIDIQPLDEQASRKDFNAFKISFVAESPVLAQKVTSTLSSLFINENVRTREEQASNTTRFLHEQVMAKARRLEEQEQRLRDFKMQHIGELPEQQQGNLGILAGLQSQLQNTMARISRAQEQRVYLESLRAGYTRQAAVSAAAGMTTPGAVVISPAEAVRNDLVRLESTKAALSSKYTPEHPDVLKVEREIARTQAVLQRLEAAPSPARDEPAIASRAVQPVDEVLQPALAQVTSQLEANRVEIANLLKDETQLKAAVTQYQNRLNQIPLREQQQSGIARDTEALRLEYAELQKKEQESQLATNLEKQQGGQQFRLIEPASFPVVPSSPKRLKVSLGGIAAGLFLGLVAAFVVEMKNAAYYSEDELRRRLAHPLIVGVPLVLTSSEKRRHLWGGALEWLGGSVLVLSVLVAEFYVYRVG